MDIHLDADGPVPSVLSGARILDTRATNDHAQALDLFDRLSALAVVDGRLAIGPKPAELCELHPTQDMGTCACPALPHQRLQAGEADDLGQRQPFPAALRLDRLEQAKAGRGGKVRNEGCLDGIVEVFERLVVRWQRKLSRRRLSWWRQDSILRLESLLVS